MDLLGISAGRNYALIPCHGFDVITSMGYDYLRLEPGGRTLCIEFTEGNVETCKRHVSNPRAADLKSKL